MKKKKMIIGVVIILGMALLPVSSKAVLQANPNTNGTKVDTAENWLLTVRNMEKKNQAMGLEETIDSSTKKATSESNGIDVHMIKSTEWGSVAILSASGYGNSKWLQNSEIKSTTGNKSGVYFPLTKVGEWVAGNGYALSADKKYWDAYTADDGRKSARCGDAIGTSATKNPRV